MRFLDIPWVSVGSIDRPGNSMTRDYMVKVEQALGQKNYLTYTGKLNPNPAAYGQYTGRLPVYNLEGDEVFNLWFMDSRGDYGCDGNYNGKSCISKDAVTWFTNE